MCGIYCVYKQSKSCQLPFCASPIFHFEIGDFSVYLLSYFAGMPEQQTAMKPPSSYKPLF